jgi:phosphatidylserine decarboxylase
MITRDGLTPILVIFCVTAVLLMVAVKWDSSLFASLAGLFALLCVWSVFFFRDPERSFSHQEGILTAPADGRILGIDKIAHHDYVGGEALRISIFLSIFDVHINRIPADGVIDFVRYQPGKFFVAYCDKASQFNEQTQIGIITSSGHRIHVKQIAGIIARRIVCRLNAGDTVTAGQRFGMIRFGSRTELVIPSGSRLRVKTGDRVKGSRTILGFLPEPLATADSAEKMTGENVEL